MYLVFQFSHALWKKSANTSVNNEGKTRKRHRVT
jgi:hypothetical protein